MSKTKKIEELIPLLLKQISNGNGVSTVEVAKKYKVSPDIVKKRLREVRDKFYKDCFGYDGSTRKWTVKSGQIGFLQQEFLEPEEAVVLTAMSRTNDRLGTGLIATHNKIVDNYTKRAKSYIFKQQKAEDITVDMEKIFALLKHAINDRNIVQIEYGSKKREIFPYRIVYIEYYWYLVAAENGKVKSFRLSLVKSPKILDESYEYDFKNVETRLNLAMNAYIDYHEPFKIISVLVNERLVNHIEIASYFDAWKKVDYKTTIHGKNYQRFEVTTTNPNYDDIAPTIMKYMPNIIVEEPQELIDKIEENIQSYRSQYTL